MKKFTVLTKKIKPKQFNLLTGKKVKATRKSGQINLLTGKLIKRKPKPKPIKKTFIEDAPTINSIPNGLINVIKTFPKELQQFLNNTDIISIKRTAGIIILKLSGRFEVIVKDVTENNKPKQLVIIKQGKKEILKHTI